MNNIIEFELPMTEEEKCRLQQKQYASALMNQLFPADNIGCQDKSKPIKSWYTENCKNDYFVCLTDVSKNLLANDLVKRVSNQLMRCIDDPAGDDNAELLYQVDEDDQNTGVYIPIIKSQYVRAKPVQIK